MRAATVAVPKNAPVTAAAPPAPTTAPVSGAKPRRREPLQCRVALRDLPGRASCAPRCPTSRSSHSPPGPEAAIGARCGTPATGAVASTRAGPPTADSDTRTRHARRAPVSAHAAVSVPPSRSVSAQQMRSRPPGQNRAGGPQRTARCGAEQIDPTAGARDERRRRTVRGGGDRGLAAGAAQDGGPPPAAAHAARQHRAARLAPRRDGVAAAVHGHHGRPAHDRAAAQPHGGRHLGRCCAGRQDRRPARPAAEPPRSRPRRPRASPRRRGRRKAAGRAAPHEGRRSGRRGRRRRPSAARRAGECPTRRRRRRARPGRWPARRDHLRGRARELPARRRRRRRRSRRRRAHHPGGGQAAAEPGRQRFCW